MRLIAFALVFILPLFASAQTPPPPASRGNAFNPDISMNLLLLYRNSNRGNDPNVEERNGASLQEAELQFTSDVDPYWRLLGNFALHQEFDDSGLSATPSTAPTRETVFEAEEAYAESLNLSSVTLKVGKFKSVLGKHNQLHSHAYPFIDAPMIETQLLGDEGLNDVGISLAALLPTSWFSEITIQVLSGQGEGLDYYKGNSANDSVGVAHLKNLWDLSDDLTFEFGASAASGQNSNVRTTNLFGADLTFKWRPNGAKDRALIWSTEGIRRDYDQSAADERDAGFASWIQYQFGLQWWIEARGEYLQALQQDPAASSSLPEYQRKQSILVAYAPSEFSAIRLQYDRLYDGSVDDEQRATLQFNYSIGAHPAHAY